MYKFKLISETILPSVWRSTLCKRIPSVSNNPASFVYMAEYSTPRRSNSLWNM